MTQCEKDSERLHKIAFLLEKHDDHTRALFKQGDRLESEGYAQDVRIAMKELIEIALAYL